MGGMRGLISFPHRFHRPPRLVLFTREPEDLRVGSEEQVEHIGNDELIQDILAAKVQFDRVLCTVDMMPTLSKVARTLGPLGLMPSVKTGTIVAGDSSKVREAIQLARDTFMFKVDRGQSMVHLPIGPLTWPDEQLEENLRSAAKQILSTWQLLPRPSGHSTKIIREVELTLSCDAQMLEEPRCKVTKAVAIR